MESKFNISAMVLMVLLTFSCEQILVEDPPSSISLANFYETEDDALAGLYGAYSDMYSVSGRSSLNYSEMNADDLVISPNVTDAFEWDNFTYNSDVTGGLWASCFRGINRSNEVIHFTEEIDFNPERKADIIAEAKALRAYYYLQLVRVMGGVPLYEVPTVGFETIYAPRATEDEIFQLITRDLEAAATELEPTSPAGRINSDVANALLARVYLYLGDYENALTHARILINSGLRRHFQTRK